MKAFLINDGRKAQNWGLRSTSDALYSILNTKKIEVIYSLEQVYLTRNYKFDPKFKGKYILNKFSRLRRLPFLKERLIPIPSIADDFESAAKEFITCAPKEIVSKLKEADICIFNAEGSTYRANYSSKAGLFLLWMHKYLGGRKALFCNGSVELNNVDSVLYGFIQKCSELGVTFAVREKHSLNCLNQKNINAILIPDLAYLDTSTINVTKNKTQKNLFKIPKTKYVVFSKSMLPYSAYESPLIAISSHLNKKYGFNSIFLGIDPEDLVMEKLNRYSYCSFLSKNINYPEIEKIYKNATLAISGRYHHAIFALKNGCPVIPLSTTSPKIKGLMEFYSEIYNLYSLNTNPYDATYLKKDLPIIFSEIDIIIKNREILGKKILVLSQNLNNMANTKTISELNIKK